MGPAQSRVLAENAETALQAKTEALVTFTGILPEKINGLRPLANALSQIHVEPPRLRPNAF